MNCQLQESQKQSFEESVFNFAAGGGRLMFLPQEKRTHVRNYLKLHPAFAELIYQSNPSWRPKGDVAAQHLREIFFYASNGFLRTNMSHACKRMFRQKMQSDSNFRKAFEKLRPDWCESYEFRMNVYKKGRKNLHPARLRTSLYESVRDGFCFSELPKAQRIFWKAIKDLDPSYKALVLSVNPNYENVND